MRKRCCNRSLGYVGTLSVFLRTCRLASVLFLLIPLIGCRLLETPAGMPDKQGRVRFASHNFSAYCFNTYECRVDYDNFRQANRPSGEKTPPVPGDWSEYADAGYGGVRNFPEPAIVKWRSLDGVYHETYVDIAQIFSSEQVVHRAPPKKIKMNAPVLDPDIILMVDDRDIRIYMRALILLNYPKTSQDSSFANDLILVHSKKY